MTTLTFTHGIVSHSTTTSLPGGTQNFLVSNSNKVDLHAPLDQSLVVAFAQRDTNYLITIQRDSNVQAWGYGSASDFNQGMNNVDGGGLSKNTWYLYININRITGQTTYGHSIYEPTSGTSPPYATSPMNRPDDQHWFDTTNNTMKVWRASGVSPTYGKWVEVVRVFVTKYVFSSSFISLSSNAPSFIGTTVGLTGSFRAGSLVFDILGKPLIRTTSDNTSLFFTTEDVFTTGIPSTSSPVSGNRARYETFLVDAIGIQPASAYSIVKFTDFNEVFPLDAYLQNDSLWGMIEFPIGASGDLVQVTMSGVVRNPSWNWSSVGQQIYIDKNQVGVLVTVEDDGYEPFPNQLPVAYALEKTSVLIRRPEISLTTSSGGGGDHGELTGLGDDDHTQYLNITRGDARYYTKTELDASTTGSPLTSPSGAKIDKVSGTAGNLVVIKPDGNLEDAGVSTTGMAGSPLPYYTKTELDASTTGSPLTSPPGAKIDKVGGIVGNLVIIKSDGNLEDAGVAPSDFSNDVGSPLPYYTKTELDASTTGSPPSPPAGAKVDKVGGTTGNLVKIKSDGNLEDAGILSSNVVTSVPYDIAIQVFGSVPGGGGIDAEVLRLKIVRDIVLNRDFVGSPALTDYAEARIGPTLSFTINIWVTDSNPAESTMPATGPGGIANPIATITFTPSGSPQATPNVGVFSWTGSPSTQLLLPAGSTLIAEGITTTDTTLSDIFFTILAYEK